MAFRHVVANQSAVYSLCRLCCHLLLSVMQCVSRSARKVSERLSFKNGPGDSSAEISNVKANLSSTFLRADGHQIRRQGLHSKTKTLGSCATYACKYLIASLAGMRASSEQCSLGLCLESHMWAACRQEL